MSVHTPSVHTPQWEPKVPRIDRHTHPVDDSAEHGPDGGTWAHADWTARVRPTESRAITAYPMRDVWLVEVAAPFSAVAEEVDQAVGQALAECPRGVVLELTVPLTQMTPVELDLLASTGRHPWAWPATPVAVSSNDPTTTTRLQHHPVGRHLTQCSSMLQGWARIVDAEPAATARLGVVPNARASKVARQFVARTCLGWHLASRRDAAVVIASELTTNAVLRACAGLDILLALSRGRLRIAVRDRDPTRPSEPTPNLDNPSGPTPHIVHALADLTGTLPTKDGGQMVWAVLGPR
jgi:hypothetical protein